MNKLMASILPQNTVIDAVIQEVEEEITRTTTPTIANIFIDAVIQEVEEDSYVIASKGISLKAKKAFSCLVSPIVGDKVSVCVEGESIYITAILERREHCAIDIVAANGINIIAEDGDITFNTQESMNAFAAKSNVVISEVSFLTNITTIKSHAINIIASVYQGFIDKVTLRHKSLDKFVEGHEEHQSLSSRRVIKGSDIHQVQESITLVKGQMKVDASIVNIG